MSAETRRSVACAVIFCFWSLSIFAQSPGKRHVVTNLQESAQVSAVAEHEVSPVVSGLEGAARTDDGRIQVMVELADPPAAVIFAEAMKGAAPSDQRARRFAASATSAHISRLRSEQARVAAALTGPLIGARELYRVQKALNGIAVAVAPEHVRELLSISGVKRLLPIVLEFPTNSTSVPFIGAPKVWANTIGLPAGADGTGIRIGIIDTGIDYMHADFGGTGLLADYQAESTDTATFTTVGTATAGPFPTAKVVGGTDFAGDAYTGGNVPVPDVNPMDCNGHGSHVAGTAAGFGVTAAGVTFTGPYDANSSTYSPLRIGPGTAPKALLYALRVFGCTGGTGLTTQAIDWAMDPNGDNDLSDHLDVINMSLGSDNGTVVNSTSVASDNAALAGVIVVISAGNAGDTFFIAGAPGVASRAIATAASVDDGVPVGAVTVNSPGSIAGSYLATIPQYGPTPTGQTGNAVLALDPANGAGPLTTDACSPLTNAAAIAGNICVVDRGTCSFKTKTLNCQNAGAIGVVAVDNAPGSPPPGTADDPAVVTPITIPTERVTLVDGTLIKNTMVSTPPVNVTLVGANGGDTMASFSSRGPRHIFGSPLRLKPDIAAPGLNITSVQTGHTCTGAGCTGLSDPSGFQAGNQSLTISGTSMACPHMTGVMALLRQLKPGWSVEELKALAMNYAIHDVTLFPSATPPRFGPSRVGGGRVDPALSALGDVIAMNAEDAGLVSVTFNPEVTGVVTQLKKIRVVNKGLTSQTYNMAFDNVVDSPGVSFSLPGGSSVTVPAGQSVDLDVLMSANSSLMDHTRDASLFPTQGVQANYGDQPRNFLTEEASYLTFSQSSTLKFRLPVYMAEKPSSNMSAADSIVTGGAPTGSTTIALSGTDLCSGTLAAGPTCTGTFPTDVESLVSPFELQVVSGRDPAVNDYADIHYAGTAFVPGAGSPSLTNDLILFGVASWGDWSTPNDVAYDICVDNNNDGVYDRIVINSNPSIFVANASQNDNFVRVIENTATAGFTILGLGSFVNLVGPNVIDTALHMNNVMILGATPSQMGFVSAPLQTLRYKVVTCPGSNPGCARTTTGDRCSPPAGTYFDQAAGPFTYNWGAQGLNFGGDFLDEDLNGNTLPVTWNVANLTANGSLGALLLHHHNTSGKRAEVVLLDTAASVDLGVTAGYAPPTPALNTNITITVNVTNPVATPAAGVEVQVPLPAGLTFVSSTSTAGTYASATGVWTVGAVATGTQTLTITATVASTDPQQVIAEITAGTPADPNPANNRSSFIVSAPRSSDLLTAMTTSGATALVGSPISYTIKVTNNGVDPAYSIDVADSFPSFPALSPTSFTASQGVFNPVTKIWNVAGLGNGASATLTLGLNAPNMAGGLQNSAVASASTADPNAANNTDAKTINILSPANVSGVKSRSGTSYIGGTVTYTVVLTNTAAFAQQDNPGNEFTDVLPSALTLVSANATSGTAVATIGTNTVTWNGSIAASGSVTITVTATVNGTAVVGSTVTNTGTINYDADGNGTNEAVSTATNGFIVTSPATVTATKTVAGQLRPGGAIVYTVVLHNAGPAAQLDNPGNEFTDVLPATLTLVSATASSGTAVATIGTNTVTWSGSIAVAGNVTLTIAATVSPGAAPLSTISNQGTVSYDADGNQTNEAAAVTDNPGTGTANDPTSFVVSSPATVTATKTVTGQFRAGGAIVYTVVLHNAGPAVQLDNPGNEFTDVLPSTLTLVSVTASSGTAVATIGTNTVTWNGSIAAAGNVTITIAATVSASAPALSTISNQGTINYDADGNATNESTAVTDDPGTGTANDATSFTVVSPAGITFPSKTVTGSFRVGTNVTYTILVHNGGPGAQLDNPGGEFTDVLPPSLALVSATATSGTAVATIATNTATWDGSIASGGNLTITIVAAILGSTPPLSVIANQGTFHADADGNGTNETNVVTDDPGTAAAGDPTNFVVLSPATISSATKTVAGAFLPGFDVTYTVVIRNSAPDAQLDNPGDEFVDTLPSSLTPVSVSATTGTASATGQTVHWNGSIPGGGSVTITITAKIGSGVPLSSSISNQGTINFDADGNGTNESTLLTDDPGTAAPSDPTTFAVAAVIPAISPIGLMLLSVLLAALGLLVIRRAA